MKLTILFLSAALTSISFAADFNNHMTSGSMVSPAQWHQFNNNQTDFAATSLSNTDKTGDSEDKMSGSWLYAGGVYGINPNLKLATQFGYGNYSAESSGSNYDSKSTVLAPSMTYASGDIVIAVALTYNQDTIEFSGTELSNSYIIPTFAALYNQENFEAGFSYSGEKKEDGADDELDIEEASVMTFHGRYKLDSQSAVGGSFKNTGYASVDSDNNKDQQSLRATYENWNDKLRWDGQFNYNGAYYKSETEGFSSSTIATMGFGGGADFKMNETTNVGGALTYETGSETANDTKVSVTNTTFSVRGNMLF